MFDLVSPEDTEIRTLLRKSQAQASISKDDVADGAVPCYAAHIVRLREAMQMTTMTRGNIPALGRTRSNLSWTALHDHKHKNVISQNTRHNTSKGVPYSSRSLKTSCSASME